MQSTKPGKRPFFKYMTPETTLAVLHTRAVRYSSPLSFNDPFDVQSGLHFDFDLSELHSKLVDRIQVLAAAPDIPNVDQSDVWGQVVLMARKHYTTRGFNRDRWIELTSPSFADLCKIIGETQEQYQTFWRQKLLPGIRVFCVSEDRDNLLMWAHYARDHTGAVFELWSLPEEDNPLSVAGPIEYAPNPPSFFSEREFIESMTGVHELNFSGLYKRYAYAKSDHWSYEKEWRVWYPFSESTTSFDTVPLRKSEVKARVLGSKHVNTTW
jgi:Protein of unknown function (DUF2971)